ncbi:MAG: hypothetical protein ABI237_10990 [Ginsengibacter sp.]
MRKKEKINRARKVTIRFTDAEYNKIELSFKATTKRKLSEYLRYVLLDKPVTVYTRDQSLDHIAVALSLLKSELSAIGNNFNQAVKRLHTMNKIPEIKSWAEWNEKNRMLFMQKTEEINQKIAQLVQQWWQE